MCALLACALLCTLGASAQSAPAEAHASETAAQGQPGEAQPPATDTAGAAAPGSEEPTTAAEPEAAPPSAGADAARLADEKLQRELAEVRYEQEHSSTLVPWIFTATGVAMLVTGLIVGAQAAISCHSSCSSPWWPGWMVVGGSTVAMAGVVWLKLDQRDSAELQSRRYQLEQEFERNRINAAPLPAGPQAMLRLRAAF